MKINRLRFNKKSDPNSSIVRPSLSKNILKRFNTLELVLLATLPIDAAILYSHQTKMDPIVVITPFEVEAPIKLIPPISVAETKPVLEPVKPKELIKELQIERITHTAQPATPSDIPADLAEEIRLEKEKIDDWGESLVSWNQEANLKVKETMKKISMEPPKEGTGRPRRLGSMTYGFQTDQNIQTARIANYNAISAQGPGSGTRRSPTSVQDIDLRQKNSSWDGGTRNNRGNVCSLSPPINYDNACRAKYPCRICGGCCCRTEARLASLI